ncbi:MAG: hypothetical protein EHM40_02400 [Chloroflexi bacterium]|nr:MAG: hypothetical protein EHM40_02400 [Chloroflexota bacterium]
MEKKKDSHHQGYQEQRKVAITPIKNDRKCRNEIADHHNDLLHEIASVDQHREWDQQKQEVVIVKIGTGKQRAQRRGAQQKFGRLKG